MVTPDALFTLFGTSAHVFTILLINLRLLFVYFICWLFTFIFNFTFEFHLFIFHVTRFIFTVYKTFLEF